MRLSTITMLIVAAFAVSGFNLLTHEYSDIMNSMKIQMDTIKNSQTSDHYFANMMIVHHQSAIEMNDVLQKKGKDKKLNGMAKKMSKDQEKDIRELREFVSSNSGDTMNMVFNRKLKMQMDKMSIKTFDMKATGDYDKDYVMMMIPHHQASIESAALFMEHGKSPELKKMVEKMKMKHEKELQEMQDWMDKNK